MNMRPLISVCMATYNGEKYIKRQLETILENLHDDDEIIITDDKSTDSTIKIIKSFKDERIKLTINNTRLGVNKNFSKAISLSKNDYIFLSDQDDIWLKNRIDLMLEQAIAFNIDVLSSNFTLVDENENIIANETKYYLKKKDSNKNAKNIIHIFNGKIDYFGCAMLFKKRIKKIITPIPNFIQSHDLWIAMIGNILNSNYHLESPHTLNRRIHGNNFSTVKRGFLPKLYSRIIFLRSLITIFRRIKENPL